MAPVKSLRPANGLFAQFERRLIGQRTKDALAVKKANGVKLGRPREISAETVERIEVLHERGLSAAAIARKLNDEGVSTPRGGAGITLVSRARSRGFVRDVHHPRATDISRSLWTAGVGAPLGTPTPTFAT